MLLSSGRNSQAPNVAALEKSLSGYPNAKVTGKDSIDFGDGAGDIDVLTSEGTWWWGPKN